MSKKENETFAQDWTIKKYAVILTEILILKPIIIPNIPHNLWVPTFIRIGCRFRSQVFTSFFESLVGDLYLFPNPRDV